VSPCRITIPVRDYDLAATLNSGQAFRWQPRDGAWEGMVGRRWVRLRGNASAIEAETPGPAGDWQWLTDYLQSSLDLAPVLASFPDDEPMRAAVRACRGLRLLRQDPWECLASFILSSAKQIVQIRQMVAALCREYGDAVPAGLTGEAAHAFPRPERLAALTERDLRACQLGFRAPYLLGTARHIAEGRSDLRPLGLWPVESARRELLSLPGVGRKIADCVLLFAYDHPTAFPVDVWVMRALRRLYFPRRRITPARLRRFVDTHFGPNAGYAQQYLFHYMRTQWTNENA
jgi:N-glycosylase/DNA lyase